MKYLLSQIYCLCAYVLPCFTSVLTPGQYTTTYLWWQIVIPASFMRVEFRQEETAFICLVSDKNYPNMFFYTSSVHGLYVFVFLAPLFIVFGDVCYSFGRNRFFYNFWHPGNPIWPYLATAQAPTPKTGPWHPEPQNCISGHLQRDSDEGFGGLSF